MTRLLLVGLESWAFCLEGVMLRRGGGVLLAGIVNWELCLDGVQKVRQAKEAHPWVIRLAVWRGLEVALLLVGLES